MRNLWRQIHISATYHSRTCCKRGSVDEYFVFCVDKNFLLEPILFFNGGITPWFQSLASSTVQGIETTIKFDLEYRTLFTRSSVLLRPVPPSLVPSLCVSGHVVRAIFFLRLVYDTEMHWPRKPGKTSYKDQVTYRLQFRFKYPSTSFTFQEARNSLWHFIRFISNLSYKLIRCLLALLDCLPICMLFCFYSNRQ